MPWVVDEEAPPVSQGPLVEGVNPETGRQRITITPEGPPPALAPLSDEELATPKYANPPAADIEIPRIGNWVVDAEVKPKKPDIDYETGAPFMTRVELQRAANPEEAALVLKDLGYTDFGMDDNKDWWVGIDGKKVSVFPQGGIGQSLYNVVPGMLAAASPMAGAAAGAAAGTPAGPFGMAVGAGLGAAGGYLADQIVKGIRGTYAQTPAELTGNLSKEAALNTALMGAGPAARGAKSMVGDVYRRYAGTTPETEALVRNFQNAPEWLRGYTGEPLASPMVSASPKAPRAIRKERTFQNVIGDPQEGNKLAYLEARLRGALEDAFPGESEQMLKAITKQMEAPPKYQVERALGVAAQQQTGAARAIAEELSNNLTAAIRQVEGAIRQISEKDVGSLGRDVAQRLKDKRKWFGQAMKRLYGTVDQAAGNRPVIDISNLIDRAKSLVEMTDPSMVPPYVRAIAQLDDAARKTFSEVHQLRTNLRSLIDTANLTGGPMEGALKIMAKEADDSISAAARSGALPPQARAALIKTDRLYQQGIERFNSQQMRQLLLNYRSDPEKIAKIIAMPGQTELSKTILKMMPREMRDRVAVADLRNLVSQATDPVSGSINGLSLFKGLQAQSKIGTELFGRNGYRSLMTAMKDLAIAGLPMDKAMANAAFMSPGAFREALERHIAATNILKNAVSANPMNALASGNPAMARAALDVITSPKSEGVLRQAAQYFGTNSPTWHEIQKHAAETVLRKAYSQTPSGNMVVSHKAIKDAMSSYSEAQQKLLFPRGFAEDMANISKEVAFLFQKPPDGGTSLASAWISQHAGFNPFDPLMVPANMMVAKWWVHGKFIQSPLLMRTLGRMRKEDPGAARQLLNEMVKKAIFLKANEAQMGP